MSLLTMVRHGQASYMSADYDKLSPMGEEQAVKLGQFWVRHEWTFDRVFHGPAKRHIRTMELAGAQVKDAGLPWPKPELLTAFDEFDAYSMMKLMVPQLVEVDDEVRARNQAFVDHQDSPEAGRLLQLLFEAVAHHWCTDKFATPGVETWSQFRERITAAVMQLRSSAPRSSHTAVFTSAGPIAATVASALDLRPNKSIEFVWLSRNCSYSEFLMSGDRFSLSSFNSFPHLDDKRYLTYR